MSIICEHCGWNEEEDRVPPRAITAQKRYEIHLYLKHGIPIPDMRRETTVKKGDTIWWNLDLVKEAIEVGEQDNILLEVAKIETSMDGSKIVWLQRANRTIPPGSINTN